MKGAPRHYERDARGKSISKACSYLRNCMETCTDFDQKINSEFQYSIQNLMAK